MRSWRSENVASSVKHPESLVELPPRSLIIRSLYSILSFICIVVLYEKACVRTPGVDAALAGFLMVSSESSGSMSRATFDTSKFCVIWMDFALIPISLDFPLLSR